MRAAAMPAAVRVGRGAARGRARAARGRAAPSGAAARRARRACAPSARRAGVSANAAAAPAAALLDVPQLPPKGDVYAHLRDARFKPDAAAATLAFVPTVAGLFGAYWLAAAGLQAGGGLGTLAVAGAGTAGWLLKTRLFMCFHDMAHNSFWPASSEAGKLANRVFGALSGAVVYTSYARWCKIHNNHHNVSNNLDENQHAQTAPWSMRERGEAEPGTRRTFDAKYNALVQWIVGPWFVFFVVNRKCSAFENALWAAPLVACYAVGGLPLLLFEFAVSYVTAFTGMCLFHAQHTFDGVYKRRGEEWDFFENGLLGSSLLLIPEALKPFTLGIEYHHIHHLSTGVPSYKLRECHEAGEKKGLWDAVPTLPLSSIPATMPYAVWDEDGQEFLSVPQAQTRD